MVAVAVRPFGLKPRPLPRPETSLPGFLLRRALSALLNARWVLPPQVIAETTHTPDFKNAVKPLAERYDPNGRVVHRGKVGYRVNCGRDVLAPSLSARGSLSADF